MYNLLLDQCAESSGVRLLDAVDCRVTATEAGTRSRSQETEALVQKDGQRCLQLQYYQGLGLSQLSCSVPSSRGGPAKSEAARKIA